MYKYIFFKNLLKRMHRIFNFINNNAYTKYLLQNNSFSNKNNTKLLQTPVLVTIFLCFCKAELTVTP